MLRDIYKTLFKLFTGRIYLYIRIKIIIYKCKIILFYYLSFNCCY